MKGIANVVTRVTWKDRMGRVVCEQRLLLITEFDEADMAVGAARHDGAHRVLDDLSSGLLARIEHACTLAAAEGGDRGR